MAYSLEGCSAYQIESIQDKEVIIFDSHNMAHPTWERLDKSIQYLKWKNYSKLYKRINKLHYYK